MALVVGIEAIVALTPLFTGERFGFTTCLRALFHVPHIAFLLGFAIALPISTSGGATRIGCQRLLYGGYAAITVTALARFADLDVYSDASRPWLILQIVGNFLLAVAGPGLWGAALARRMECGSIFIRHISRLFANTAFVGLALLFGAESMLLLEEDPAKLLAHPPVALMWSSSLLLVGRGCLCWSAVDSWRESMDEPVVLARTRRILKLMPCWLVAASVSSVITAYFWHLETRGWGVNRGTTPLLIWNGIVQVTLAVIVAILVAVALESPEKTFQPRPRGPVFPPPPPPSTDNSPIDLP